VLAQNLASLLCQAPITARRRLAAARLLLQPIKASALFRYLAHHSSNL
jgi:hypothetical protein